METSGSLHTLRHMGYVRQEPPAQRRRVAVLRRNGAMDRLRTITATVAVLTVSSVGIVAVYVSKALPGHQAHTTTNSSATNSSGPNSATNGGGVATAPSSSAGGNSLNPASTPTQPATSPPPVTSGAT